MRRLLAMMAFACVGLFTVQPAVAQNSSMTLTGEIYSKWDTPWGMTLTGTTAYIASQSTGLRIVDVSNPTSIIEKGRLLGLGSIRDVAVSNGVAYVVSTDSGLVTVDVATPSNPIKLWSPDPFSGEWYMNGADHVDVNNGYAYISNGSNVRVLDVHTPSAPVIDVTIDTLSDPAALTVSGNYLYVADNASYELVVYDVSDPTTPVPVATWTDTAAFSYFNADYLRKQNDFLLAGNYILDVSNPSQPSLIGNIYFFGMPTDAFLIGNTLYVDNDESLDIFDATDLSSLTQISSTRFDDVVPDSYLYSHSFYVSGTDVYASVHSSHNAMISLDASSPSNIEMQSQIVGNGGRILDVDLSGSTLFAADDGKGLRYVDASNPSSMTEIGGHISTYYSDFTQLEVSGDKLYASKASDSLFIYDISAPSSPTLVGETDMGATPHDLFINGNILWVANSRGFAAFDVGTPSAITELSQVDLSDNGDGIAVSGNHAYVVQQYGDFVIYDVSNPSSPVSTGSLSLGSAQALDVEVVGSYALVAAKGSGMQVIDIADPSNPIQVSSVYGIWSANTLQLDGTIAFLGTEDSGLYAIDVSDPSQAKVAAQADSRYPIEGIAVDGTTIYTAETYRIGAYTLALSSVDDPGNAATVGRYAIEPAYPNPFNPSTRLNYSLPRQADVSLAVYNVLGQRVAQLVKGRRSAGRHVVTFNASHLGSGIYFAVFEAAGKRQVRKLNLVR